jgi:DNA replication and repair protein RecF
MTINSLRITNFRNLSSMNLIPCPTGLNVIWGENGSGKTNLLEAIYYLGIGKSFRHSKPRCLIKQSQDEFSLFARIMNKNEEGGDTYTTIGMQRRLTGSLRLHIADNTFATISQLAYILPIRVIHSQSHYFFELGSIFRRKYLDWGLFYQCQSFLSCWHHYMQMLRQRNAALRHQCVKKEVDAWTKELVKYGSEFDKLRRDYLNHLIPIILNIAQELLPTVTIQITYHPGWDHELDFASALACVYSKECHLGYTYYGPHRADMEITTQGVPIQHVLSRGQQKLLICAMILAQGILLAKQTTKAPVYLVDDLPAELDRHSKTKLLALLSKQNTQVFITAIESQPLGNVITNLLSEISLKMFHVEHGRLLNI